MILRKYAAPLAIVLASLSVSGCIEDDDGSSGEDGPFLSPGVLTPDAKLKEKSESQVLAELKDESFLYDDEPEEAAAKVFGLLQSTFLAEAETAEDKCLEDLFHGIVSEGDATTLSFEGHFDATKCLKSDEGVALAMTVGVFVQTTCNNVDLTPYVGKSLGELSSADGTLLKDLVCDVQTFLVNSQADVSGSGKVTLDKESVEFKFQGTSYGYVGEASGNPCTRSKVGEEVKITDGCLSIDKSTDTVDQNNGKPTEDEGAGDYSRFETFGVAALASGENPYFAAGKIKAQVNGWNGELTYSGGATPPLYSMNSGTKLIEGVLGVTGKGYLSFGDEKTMAVGTCGVFQVMLKSGDKKPIPAASDVVVALSSTDGKLFSDSACKTTATSVTIAKGTSSVPFYAQPKDAETTDFYVKADPDGDYSNASLSVELTGIDKGNLEFADTTGIRVGECKKIEVQHTDKTPAIADVTVGLKSDDASIFSDATCATVATQVVFQKDSSSAPFYLKANADAYTVYLTGTVPKTSYISSLSLNIDTQKVTISPPTVFEAVTCTKVSLIHGYESDATAAAAPGDLSVSLFITGGTSYSDATCATPASTLIIPAGSDHLDFYVKPNNGVTTLNIYANPDGPADTSEVDVPVNP